MKKLIVVGSLNADLVQSVARLPQPGETVLGDDLRVVPGGKGGNQAAAAGLLGGSPLMIGAVGQDQFSGMLLESLNRANVDTSGIERVPGASGTACILVLPNGENLIVVSPAANARLTREQVAREFGSKLNDNSIVLCQLEVPMATTKEALGRARQAGAVTILDPAPAQALDAETLHAVTFLTPNQTEAALLLGSKSPVQTLDDAREAGKNLLKLGPENVILKLGALGSLLVNKQGSRHVPGFAVNVVDTTAAGDTFNGAFAVALAEGQDQAEAAHFANAAAALSVTKPGAQSSIPTRRQVQEFLETKFVTRS